MSREVKPSNLFSVALVGGASLKGRAVREVLGERNFPSVEIKLLDDEEALGQLEQVNDELTFVQGVLPEHLEGVDFAFLTAEQPFIEKVWTNVRGSGSEIKRRWRCSSMPACAFKRCVTSRSATWISSASP